MTTEVWAAVGVLALLAGVVALCCYERWSRRALDQHVDTALGEFFGTLPTAWPEPRPASALFWDHECGPRCERPAYTGPVILGRRCQVCYGPAAGTDICDPCWDAEERAFARRADR